MTAPDQSKQPPEGSDAQPRSAKKFDLLAMQAEIGALLQKQIFFLGGTAKSGTTWLQVLLDAHPHVSCTGENHLVNVLSPGVQKTLEEYNRIVLDPRGNTAFQLGKAPTLFDSDDFSYVFASAMLALLLKQAKAKPAALAIGDKTPQNVRLFGLLTRLIPGSKCIHIVRDPRDAAVSGWHHIRRLYPEQASSRFPTQYEYAKHYAEVWEFEVARGVRFGKRSDRYIEARYEDLSERPAATLKRLFGFLGVEHDDALVERCFREASFEKLTGGRARGDERRDSFFRKGVVGDWKTGLSPESLDVLVAKCGDLMRHFGYL